MSASDLVTAAAGRDGGAIARPPSTGELLWDRIFRRSTFVIATGTVLLTGYVVFSIARVATPAMHT